MNDVATFELAMNESSRLCVRLEHIFSQIRHYVAQRGQDPRHMALGSYIELLQVLDRPDVRTRLLYLVQGITEYYPQMSPAEAARFESMREGFLNDLHYLRSEPIRFGVVLAQDALLKQLRAYLSMHGRAAYYMAPLCLLWNAMDENMVLACFQRWFDSMVQLEVCVVRIMQFLRMHYQSIVYEVPLGFAKWDVPKGMQVFFVGINGIDMLIPAVSSGQQMISVTFYKALWGPEQIMERYEYPVRFEWMVCMLPIRRSM